VKSSVRFNSRLLTTATFDSGALGLLVHLIHRFPQAGTYQAVVLRDGQRVGSTCFRVTDQTAGTQLNIDLASVALPAGAAKCVCREHPESAPAVSPEGYVLFHAPRGIGSYAVVVGESREGAQAVFDRRSLTDGDLFALILIEPTTHGVEFRKARGRARSAWRPFPRDGPPTVAPVYVDATGQGFQPAQVNVHAGQAIVFRARGAKRIVITKRAAPQAARRAAAPAAPGARRVRRHVRVWRPGARREGPRS
jgi:hypothetical protein